MFIIITFLLHDFSVVFRCEKRIFQTGGMQDSAGGGQRLSEEGQGNSVRRFC